MSNQRRITCIVALAFSIILGNLSLLAQTEVEATAESTSVTADAKDSDKGIDWLQLAMETGYIFGVLVLFPCVIYLNLKEGLYDPDVSANPPQPIEDDLHIRERRAQEILDNIEAQWGTVKGEDGATVRTILSRKQALATHAGLDYIRMHLAPEESEIKTRLENFEEIYEDRTRRIFTGSNWVLGSAVLVGALFLLTGGVGTFIFIHALGILFYYFSSRTPAYILDRRLVTFGKMPGMIGSVMAGLMAGGAAKHYVSVNGGAWQRDHEGELQAGMITILFLAIAALFLGLLAAFLGVINFFINYLGTFLYPWKSIAERYQRYFG